MLDSSKRRSNEHRSPTTLTSVSGGPAVPRGRRFRKSDPWETVLAQTSRGRSHSPVSSSSRSLSEPCRSTGKGQLASDPADLKVPQKKSHDISAYSMVQKQAYVMDYLRRHPESHWEAFAVIKDSPFGAAPGIPVESRRPSRSLDGRSVSPAATAAAVEGKATTLVNSVLSLTGTDPKLVRALIDQLKTHIGEEPPSYNTVGRDPPIMSGDPTRRYSSSKQRRNGSGAGYRCSPVVHGGASQRRVSPAASWRKGAPPKSPLRRTPCGLRGETTLDAEYDPSPPYPWSSQDLYERPINPPPEGDVPFCGLPMSRCASISPAMSQVFGRRSGAASSVGSASDGDTGPPPAYDATSASTAKQVGAPAAPINTAPFTSLASRTKSKGSRFNLGDVPDTPQIGEAYHAYHVEPTHIHTPVAVHMTGGPIIIRSLAKLRRAGSKDRGGSRDVVPEGKVRRTQRPRHISDGLPDPVEVPPSHWDLLNRHTSAFVPRDSSACSINLHRLLSILSLLFVWSPLSACSLDRHNGNEVRRLNLLGFDGG